MDASVSCHVCYLLLIFLAMLIFSSLFLSSTSFFSSLYFQSLYFSIYPSHFKIDTLASRKWTGRQLHSALTRVSSILADGECLGLKKGDVVVFSCPNSDWHAILLLSVSTRGGIYTGTDDSYPYRKFRTFLSLVV